MIIRTPFNYSKSDNSVSNASNTGEKLVTKQSFKDECDINNIVRRFGVTGQMPVADMRAMYGEFDTITDYQSALNKVMDADKAFMTVPSDIRARFNNNPAEYMRFLSELYVIPLI